MNRKFFDTKEEAIDDMKKAVDDPYIDNIRIARLDVVDEMAKFAEQYSNGCCGFYTDIVYIDGYDCIIGCNYGH